MATDGVAGHQDDATAWEGDRLAASRRRHPDVWLIRLITFVVVTGLVGLAATLLEVFHAPQVLLVALIATILIDRRTRLSLAALPGPPAKWRHILLILLVALIFRVPAYHYVMGGQDEGLYVNVAHYINATGGLKARDKVRESLEGTPYVERYDASNQFGTSYLAGVYRKDATSSKLQFQFYDMFQVWMALFDGLFGISAGVYALTFLALLSIVLLYRIALLLSGSIRAALFMGGLLAVSPLHAFFSKFPVTEVPTLCFTASGFLLIAVYWSAARAVRRRGWWVLSVFAFLCVFTTRISGFMYMPFLIGAAWFALLLDADVDRRRGMQRWAIWLTVAYLVSVAYGTHWASHYSRDIYRLSFAPLLGVHWKTVIVALGLLVVLVWIGLARLTRPERPLGERYPWLKTCLVHVPTVVVVVALCIGLLQIYWLGWTGHYQGVAWLTSVWHLAGNGWRSVLGTSLWMLLVMMCPFMVAAFLVAVVMPRPEPRLVFLRWLVAGFFAYLVVLQWTVPYGPYYTRYLLSDFVPYALLLVVVAWAAMPRTVKRTAITGAILGTLIYSTALSAAQIGKNEDQGAFASTRRIASRMQPSDLILLDEPPGSCMQYNELKTPLIYTFGRHVATVDSGDLRDLGYMSALDARYDNVFLLTADTDAPLPGYRFVIHARYKVQHYEWNHSFPHRLVTWRDCHLSLYERIREWSSRDAWVSFAAHGGGVAALRSGWASPQLWGTWSVGNRSELSIDPADLPDSTTGVVLRFTARVFVNPKHPQQRIDVAVNGGPPTKYVGRYPNDQVVMTVPIAPGLLQSDRPIRITFALPDAISPAALGQSADQQPLALGLERAQVLKHVDAAQAKAAAQ